MTDTLTQEDLRVIYAELVGYFDTLEAIAPDDSEEEREAYFAERLSYPEERVTGLLDKVGRLCRKPDTFSFHLTLDQVAHVQSGLDMWRDNIETDVAEGGIGSVADIEAVEEIFRGVG